MRACSSIFAGERKQGVAESRVRPVARSRVGRLQQGREPAEPVATGNRAGMAIPAGMKQDKSVGAVTQIDVAKGMIALARTLRFIP